MSCNHRRAGIVTNQPNGYDPKRAHAATNVCDRSACIDAALNWVKKQTGEFGFYISDASRRDDRGRAS